MEASSLLSNATAPLKSSSSSSSPQSNDNQVAVAANTAASDIKGDSPAQQTTTISKDDDEQSSSRVSTQINDQHPRSDNHNDSSVKLKRCKHGRIIIKDLSKKKLAQQSDNGAITVTDKHSESNNNQIINSGTPTKDNGTLNELNQLAEEQLDSASNEELAVNSNNESSINIKCQPKPQPRTPPIEPNEQIPNIEPDNQISNSNDTDKRGAHRCLILRARARSQSSNGSLSPPPVVRNTRNSPPRRSRHSRSPARRERSISRDRIERVAPRRHYDSPSPRRRDQSSSSRRKRKKERKRSPSRRQYRTPDRHRRSDTLKNHRNSPTYGSPDLKLPRSRSITPSRQRDNNRRRSQRDNSRSVSRDPSRYDRYSNVSRERSREQFDKAPIMQSRDDRRLRADAIDSAAVESYISINKDNHDSKLAIKKNVVQSITKSSLAQIIADHQQPAQKFSPKQAQVVEASPKRSQAAPSPATPLYNDDSASDIYDPEGPIIPISPCDSPPISPIANNEPSTPKDRPANNEKNGDDDVPSSAVQLNQQEKYLQKLNRQERVIEEVKVALRPFYQNRSIDKEQYKDVLRRAVPKICHSKNGEINPIKIRALVDAYVKKMKRH